jgi:hypothetical protein
LNTAALRCICAVTYFVYAANLSGANLSPAQTGTRESEMASSAELGQIITQQGNLIMELEDVVGLGEGLCKGEPCIRVFMTHDNAVTIAKIQELLEGTPFEIEISGDFIASPQ